MTGPREASTFRPTPKQWALLGIVLGALGCAVVRAIVQMSPDSSSSDVATFEGDPMAKFSPETEWEELLQGGDVEAGERLFFDPNSKVRCAECHRFRGRGESLGPDLSTSAKTPIRRLMREIVNPNRTLTGGFESITISLTDGRILAGRKHGPDHAQKVWVRMSDGILVEVPRSRIEPNGIQYSSSMPNNYAELLTLSDFRDLIALLHSPEEETEATKQPTRGSVAGPADAGVR